MANPTIPQEHYGRWTVIQDLGPVATGKGRARRRVMCRCQCGTVRSVVLEGLTNGHSRSCGCAKREQTRERNFTHRQTGTPTYRSWAMMIQRCRNLNNKHYGGRGIYVCDEWKSFERFLHDMGQRPSLSYSLERMDNDGPYTPANCKWATSAEQHRNYRRNHWVTINGETLCLHDWALRLGLRSSIPIHKKIARGMSDVDAILSYM